MFLQNLSGYGHLVLGAINVFEVMGSSPAQGRKSE